MRLHQPQTSMISRLDTTFVTFGHNLRGNKGNTQMAKVALCDPSPWLPTMATAFLLTNFRHCPSILSPAPTATCISVANMAKLLSVPDSQVIAALRILASKINLVVPIPSASLFQLVVRNGRLRVLSLICDFAMLSINHLLQELRVYSPNSVVTLGVLTVIVKSRGS